MDAYKIGVNLAVTSNAPQFFSALSQQVLHLHANVNKLQGGLNRLHMVIAGGLAAKAGLGIFHGIKATLDVAKDLSHELVQIQKLGITGEQFKEVQSNAQKTVANVPGTAQDKALGAYGAAYSIFGHDEAIKLMEPLERFAQVLGNTSGNYEKAHESVYSFVRAGDLMGKFVDETTHKVDPERLRHFMDLGSKVVLGTHGKVNADTWLGLAQQGGPALSGLSDKGLLTMAIASQAMGGQRAGTALTSLYSQMVGGTMTKSKAEKLRELGLVGDFDVGKGGHVQFRKGALDNDFTRALKTDPIQAVEHMKAALEKHGEKTIEQQVPMLFEILGRQTTQRLVHDLLRNLPQIVGERERIAGAMGTGDSAKLADDKDMSKAMHNLGAAWRDLQLTIGNSQLAIDSLNAITRALRSFNQWLQEIPPERMETYRAALFGLAAGLTALGAVFIGGALVAAIGTGGWLIIGMAALAGAIGSFVAAHWDECVAAINKVKDAIGSLAEGFVNFVNKVAGLLGKLNGAPINAGKADTGPSAAEQTKAPPKASTPYDAVPAGRPGPHRESMMNPIYLDGKKVGHQLARVYGDHSSPEGGAYADGRRGWLAPDAAYS
ncbi:hypothetical protein GCM10007036_14500 [Alsobacter metallidurans]|uniref:Uncharacterized protein n=1 Tax=Alsobacter metallidurans TaxID=340221 RepID=A0A917I4V2_9HYPH|nr:hypothetical protein [Alsobacter metallidurans]GGH14892.1 hypothetical protein GCM10007036_14500 [Alsobacter metallidurans]